MKIPTEKKNTTQNMIKISPCLSSLNPMYIMPEYRKRETFMGKIDAIDQIERNFNLDQYHQKHRKKIDRLLLARTK